jgi:hypothetical protein
MSDWGHTYPVQSKRGETILGDEMNSCTESPFYIDPHPDFDQRRSNPPEIFKRFASTDVPRGHSKEAVEYDLALDVAEKILEGNSLSMNPGIRAPYSYFQAEGYLENINNNRSSNSSDCVQDIAGLYGAGRYEHGQSSNKTNKRLANLLTPAVDQSYGTGKESSAEKPEPTLEERDDHSHTWDNVIPCTKNTVKGIAYDLKHWDRITDEQCQGNKVYYVFARDDRWKYLTFVFMCLTISILFVVGIITGVSSNATLSKSITATTTSIPVNNEAPVQRIELILKPAK